MKSRITLVALVTLSIGLSIQSFSQAPYIHHNYEKVVTPDIEPRIDFLDLDNDGDEDLINYLGSNAIRFYKSNGGWIDSLDYVSVTVTNSIMADWNNDNLPDILNNSGSFQILENTGSFSFASSVQITPSTMYTIDTAKINNDAFVDAISINNNTIDLYINQAGTYASVNYSITTPYFMSTLNTEIDFIDVENDGLKEMFVKAANDKIYIYSQTGLMDYTLQDSIVSTSIGDVNNASMYFEDLNNDGSKELITRDGWFIRVFQRTTGYNYSLVFSGDASYSVNTGFGFAGLEEISDFYDVDNNGYLDIVVGNSVFFNNNNFLFNEISINATPRLYSAYYRCSDIDNNGKTDICYVYDVANTHYEEVFYRSEVGIGQVLNSKSIIWYDWGYTNYDGDVLDFDQDGDADVLSYNHGKIVFWENINDTLYPKYGGQALPYYTEYVDVVDINQDNYEDLIWSTATGATDDHGYRINNGSVMNSGSFLINSNMHLKHIADIDDDGIQELFYHLKSGLTNNYVFMYRLNTGTPVLATTVLYWTDIDVEDVVIRLGDYDLDGLKDVVIQQENSGNNKIYIVHNDGADIFSSSQMYNIAGCEELLGVFDSNNDGIPDIHWHDGSTKIYRNLNNNGTFGAAELLYASGSFSGSNGYSTDFDNDGLTDVIVQSSSTQQIFRNYGYGLSLVYSEPSSNKISRLFDFDNDGDEDYVANDTWYENIGNSSYSMVGTVFYDLNANGTFDQGVDVMFPSFPIELNNNWLTSYTNSGGDFSMPLGSVGGSYNLTIGDAYSGQFNATTSPYPSVATVNAGSPYDSISIGVTNVNNIVDGTFDVTLSGHKCNESGRVYLQAQNFSPIDTDLEIKVLIPPNTSLIGSNQPLTQVGDTLIWQFNGMVPFELNQFYVDLNMPGTAFIGDTMNFVSTASYSGVLGTHLESDTLRQILTCAYDPNDKSITMMDHVYLGDTIYSFADETEYLIRFQNTGNDTASVVVLKDHLSPLFDWSSLEPVSASHSYNFSIDSLGIIKVEFAHINLPDSNVNFLGSMGYVKFKVNYDLSSPQLVPVNNFASIYFDQNPPIYTNLHEFYRVECDHFMNVDNGLSACYNDTIMLTNNDYGLVFDYQWTSGTYSAFSEDSAYLPFSSTGLQNYSLEISNSFCSHDSTFDIELYPLPVLNLTIGDTTMCMAQFLAVGSNLTADWYLDGNYETTSLNFYDNYDSTETLSAVVTDINGCRDSVGILISVTHKPTGMHDLDNLAYTSDYYVCPLDVIVLESNYDSLYWEVDFNSNWTSNYSDTALSVSIPLGAGETAVSVTTWIEYQGCQFNTNTYFLIDPLEPYTFYNEPAEYPCGVDSALIDGNRLVDWFIDGVYASSGFSIMATQPGLYLAQDSCGHSDSCTIIAFGSSISITSENVMVCSGDDYMMPDGTEYFNITAPIIYESIFNPLPSYCDSIVTTYLSVGIPYSQSESVDICAGTNYTFPDGLMLTNIQTIQSHVSTFVGVIACDSSITTTLNVLPSSSNFENIDICAGQNFTYPDGTSVSNLQFDETHTSIFTSVLGCDSTITTNIIIRQNALVFDTVMICTGENYIFPDGSIATNISADQDQISYLNTIYGCDSTIMLNLVIDLPDVVIDTQTACDSLTWIDGNSYYLSNNSALQVLSNVTGCDSTVYLDLTMNYSNTGTDSQTSCGDFLWIDGNSYAASNNSATYTLTNVAGCDSTITLDLIIYPEDQYTYTESTCSTYTWAHNNLVYTTSGIYADTLTNAFGCDSVITLDLTINTTPATSVNQLGNILNAIDAGYQYQWVDCDNSYAHLPGETMQQYTASQNGSYAVIISDANCSDTSVCLEVTNVSVEESLFEKINIYPNPTDDLLHFSIPTYAVITCKLMDTKGRVIKSFEISNNDVLSLALLDCGFYILELVFNEKHHRVEVLKM